MSKSSSSDLNPTEYGLSAKAKTERKTPQEKAGSEDMCTRGLVQHHQGRNSASSDAKEGFQPVMATQYRVHPLVRGRVLGKSPV